jgi:membrane protease YdiL (CAAX protease family)
VTSFALARPVPSRSRSAAREWLATAGVLVALAAIVAARWLAVTRGLDGLTVGLGFGAALAGLWLIAAGARMSRTSSVGGTAPLRRDMPLLRQATRHDMAISAAAGVAFGLGLMLVTIVGTSVAGAALPPGLARPAAPFLPWALVTLVVASAEEGILRGVLFDRMEAAGGLVAAVVVTTIVFALMHVPLYGWHVVPLDLTVGLGLAGLRVATRSIVAPAIAHTVADLATWWL